MPLQWREPSGLRWKPPEMEWLPVGDSAWRAELPAGADPAAVLEVLRPWPGVIDVVVTDHHALVRFNPLHPPSDPSAAIIGAPVIPSTARRHHIVPVRYDGMDLDEVGRVTGLTREEVIRRHSDREYSVELVGFLPGFAYLGPIDPALALPRRPTPRLRVPAGAVGIAAGRTGIYPVASPGGWHLIATVAGFKPFDPETGAAFRLGDRVRFESVS
jgi:UPF0271 protein